MKRIFTTMLVSMMTFVGVMAQMNIWYNGAVVYQRDYTLIDSITFTIQNPTSPTDITENLPTKVENMIGSPDSEVRSTLQAAGYSIQDQFTSNEELFLTFVNTNEDTIKCVFRQSNLLTDVNAIMHFSSGSSPLNIYKDWSATAYTLASWQNWNGYIRELSQSEVQYFSGRTLFNSVLNSMSTANYVAEQCTYDRDNCASLSFLKGGLISRIEYARAYRYLDVMPTAISLPDTIQVVLGRTIDIPYVVQPHGATLSHITATTDDPSIAEVDGMQLIGKNAGYTNMQVTCGAIQKSVVVYCLPILEKDGMYIIGEATTVDNIYSENRELALMGQGLNEATKMKRAGMYEKYIYLEANKDFSLVLHEAGAEDVVYGAQLEATAAITDNPTLSRIQYKGLLQQNINMQVPVSGLYHVVLDMNILGDLTNQGGAQIIVVPCEWGLRGTMNGWGYTPMEIVEQSATRVVFKYTPAVPDTLEATGSFKFAHGNCWKYQLDLNGEVKAESSIGTNATEDGGAYTELCNGGRNIPYSRGVYDYVTLTWELKGGKVCDGFSFEAHKCATLPAPNPAVFVVGISGSGLFGESGNIPAWADPVNEALAVYDADASVITDQTTKAGTYVYNISNLNFEAGSYFMFRYNGAWLGINDVDVIGVTTSGSDGIEGIVGAYNIKITVEWTGDDADEMAASSIKAEFSAGTPVE